MVVRLKIRNCAISYTDRCNITCGHCVSECGPGRSRVLGVEAVKEVLTANADSDINQYLLTGGEAMLYADDILAIAKHGHSLGMRLQLGTNGFWSKDYDKTVEVLGELKGLGLNAVYMGYDSYHAVAIPFANIGNLIRACYALAVLGKVQINEDDHGGGKEWLERFMQVYPNFTYKYQIPFVAGRMHKDLRRDSGHSAGASDFSRPCGNSIVLNVDESGNVFGCCNFYCRDQDANSAMFFGNIHERPYREILDGFLHSRVIADLYKGGPYFAARGRFGGAEGAHAAFAGQTFTSRCELCVAAFTGGYRR